MISTSSNSKWIDEDLIPEILERLPVKSLLRFRSVCKYWKSLISSSSFITLHSSFASSTTPANLEPYLRRRLSGFDESYDILGLDPECTDHFYDYALGFGYDTFKDDFKVVRIWIPSYPEDDCECKSLLPACDVYSARERVWRVSIVESIKIFQIYSETGCFVNGTVHWLVADYSFTKRFVLMFDCEHEEFTTMELPQEIDNLQDDEYVMIKLLEYGGMLSLLANWNGHVELWVMEENATSWKKLYEILGAIKLYWNNDISQSSDEKLGSYGPDECTNFRWNAELSDDTLCNNVYEESMLLMNDTDSLSYTKAEIVEIDNSDPHNRFQSSPSYYY